VAGLISSSEFSRWFSTQADVPSVANPAGPSPVGTRVTTRFAEVSIRMSAWPASSTAHTAPAPAQRYGTAASTEICALTRFVAGSIR
jgi:hypothetical protein